MIALEKVPGQIEPGEVRLLTELARRAADRDSTVIVEFGTLFGKSTACLINGILAVRPGPFCQPILHAFDAFECSSDSPFAQQIRKLAGASKLGGLIKEESNKVFFRGVYDHFIGPAEALGIVKTTAANFSDLDCDLEGICLAHVDAAKSYAGLKAIFSNFVPRWVEVATSSFRTTSIIGPRH